VFIYGIDDGLRGSKAVKRSLLLLLFVFIYLFMYVSSSIIRPHNSYNSRASCHMVHCKSYSSPPDADWVQVGNVAMIGYLVAFCTPCL